MYGIALTDGCHGMKMNTTNLGTAPDPAVAIPATEGGILSERRLCGPKRRQKNHDE